MVEAGRYRVEEAVAIAGHLSEVETKETMKVRVRKTIMQIRKSVLHLKTRDRVLGKREGTDRPWRRGRET